jgi:hypothetical protein
MEQGAYGKDEEVSVKIKQLKSGIGVKAGA